MPKDPHQAILSAEEARRAIYIDFEKNQDLLPTLVGILWQQAGGGACRFEQHVFEECFRSAAVVKALGNRGVNCFCVLSTLCHTLDFILDLAEANHGPVVAWSTFDLAIFEATDCSEEALAELRSRFRSAIPTAKAWKRRAFPQYRFPKPKAFRPGGRHSLHNYQRMIGYPTPGVAGPGMVGDRLRYIRGQLQRRDCDYARLTGVAKRKWTNLLSHNLHDCCSMREIMWRATAAYGPGNPEPCGPCAVVGSEPLT